MYPLKTVCLYRCEQFLNNGRLFLSNMPITEFLIGRTSCVLYGPWWSFCFVVVLFSLILPGDHFFFFLIFGSRGSGKSILKHHTALIFSLEIKKENWLVAVSIFSLCLKTMELKQIWPVRLVILRLELYSRTFCDDGRALDSMLTTCSLWALEMW